MTKNQKAALLMCLSVTLLTSSDALIKHVGNTLPVGQIMFVRGLISCLIFIGILYFTRRALFPAGMFTRKNVFRGGLETLAAIVFLSSLMLMPIAIATTLSWLAPLFLTLFSAIFLSEKVPLVRWGAVIIGFSGVLLVADLGSDGFSWVYILPVLAAIALALRDVVTHTIHHDLHTYYIVFLSVIIFTIAGGIWSLFQWQPLNWQNTTLLAVCAVLTSLSFITQIMAIRLGDLSFVAPFAFFGILIAVIYGVIFWDEVPSLLTITGILLIVGAGFFVVRGESSQQT